MVVKEEQGSGPVVGSSFIPFLPPKETTEAGRRRRVARGNFMANTILLVVCTCT